MRTLKKRIKNAPFIGSLFVKSADFLRWMRDVGHRYRLYQKHKALLAPNGEIKNSWQGKMCFILATGPSIKTQDLSKLSGTKCISVSNFFVHPDFAKLKPEYHVFAASHTPITDEQFSSQFRDAEAHFPEGQKVFISATDKYLVDKYQLFKKQKVYYYLVGDRRLGCTANSVDFSKQIPVIKTVAHVAVYLALHLGAVEISLLGCDHNGILNYGKIHHFYDENKNAMTARGYDGNWNTFEITLLANLETWRIYREIKNYTERKGIRLWNSTPGSLLDVLPRKNFEEVVGK